MLTPCQCHPVKVWVDASYEGDLFARAGVSYTVGRESSAKYNESLAGMSAGSNSNQFDVAVDPFDASDAHLDLNRAPYGLYGVTYIDLKSLLRLTFDIAVDPFHASDAHLDLGRVPYVL